jgi:hypothetical protein
MQKPIGRKFSPSAVLLGLGLIAGGSVVLLLFNYVFHIMPLMILIGACLALPAGVGCILFSFVPACLACGKELVFRKARVSPSARAALQKAYERGSVKDLLVVVSTHAGSKDSEASRLSCWYCPKCEAVGYLHVTGWKDRPIAGPDVRNVLGVMSA